MSQSTGIEWTDATWNPVRGCSRVSEGCRHCYAERVASRFGGDDDPFHGFAYSDKAGPHWTGKVELIPEKLDEPLRWKKPRRIFVNSMSDLFHERLSDEAIAAVFGVMALSPQHTFQILTKRTERMRKWFDWLASEPIVWAKAKDDPEPTRFCQTQGCIAALSALAPREKVNGPLFTAHLVAGIQPKPNAPIRSSWPLPNVWLGVSCEDQASFDDRVLDLVSTPAALRFISYEPALGPLDCSLPVAPMATPLLRVRDPANGPGCVHWLIVGGESGPGARPFDVAWARSAVAQCKAAGVSVFVKQLGARPEYDQGCGDCDPCLGGGPCCVGSVRLRLILRDPKGGDPSEWPEDLRVREFPTIGGAK